MSPLKNLRVTFLFNYTLDSDGEVVVQYIYTLGAAAGLTHISTTVTVLLWGL